jgi:ABC-type bacteriocin/lantibiotic exporter with double-glycine peptidase domain
MASIWTKRIIPMILTLLFSLFILLISLMLVTFSRFLRREIRKLINRYGRDNVVKIFLQGNIKGLLDLMRLSRDEQRSIQD